MAPGPLRRALGYRGPVRPVAGVRAALAGGALAGVVALAAAVMVTAPAPAPVSAAAVPVLPYTGPTVPAPSPSPLAVAPDGYGADPGPGLVAPPGAVQEKDAAPAAAPTSTAEPVEPSPAPLAEPVPAEGGVSGPSTPAGPAPSAQPRTAPPAAPATAPPVVRAPAPAPAPPPAAAPVVPACTVAQLAGTRPHVSRAGRALAARFSIPLGAVGGFRASAVDPAGHPAGLALDFTVGRATGDALAEYAVSERRALGVTYVIWRQRINYGGGWEPMEDRGGVTANHFDHVHINFSRDAPPC